MTTAARHQSTRAGSRRHRPGGENDPRRTAPFLRRPLGRIRVANRATYDAHSKSRRPSSPPSMPSSTFLVGIGMIVLPRRWPSDSTHPRPIPIPSRGTPQPPRGQIPPCPFQGGARTCPQPRRASWRRPHHHCRRRHVHHRCRRRDSYLNVVLAHRSIYHARLCQRRRRSRGSSGRTLRFPECPSPLWAAAGASAGVVASSPPAPVLAARADNDDDEDNRIIVKEMREKTKRGRRASIIAPRQRDSRRSACLLRRDMVGDGRGAFGRPWLGRGPPRPPWPRPPIRLPLWPRPQP
jgi:hypothetical protein